MFTVTICKIWQIIGLRFITCTCVAKLRGAMSRTVVIVCIVLRLIANYPCIIAVRGDNLNVVTHPDPSSSPNERSGLRVACDKITLQ